MNNNLIKLSRHCEAVLEELLEVYKSEDNQPLYLDFDTRQRTVLYVEELAKYGYIDLRNYADYNGFDYLRHYVITVTARGIDYAENKDNNKFPRRKRRGIKYVSVRPKGRGIKPVEIKKTGGTVMFEKLFGTEREIIQLIYDKTDEAASKAIIQKYQVNQLHLPDDVMKSLDVLKERRYVNFHRLKKQFIQLKVLPDAKNYFEMEKDYTEEQCIKIVSARKNETITSISQAETITNVIKNYYENNKERIKSFYDRFKSQDFEYESCPPERLSDVNANILLTTATDTEKYILHSFLKPTNGADKILRVYKGNYIYYIAQLGCYITVHVKSKAGSNTLGGSYDVLNEAIPLINPQIVFSIGVAFGINPDKQKIGDVLVADTIFPYDMNKISEGELKIKNSWFPKTPLYLINRIAQSKILLGTGYNLLQGGIASGGSVIDDAEYKKMIMHAFKAFDIIGGEMEAYGVYKQAFEKRIMCITIKSVCDYAECKNSLSDDINENEMIKDGIQLLGMDNVCKVIEDSFKDKYIFSDLNIVSKEEVSIKQNQIYGEKISENKYVEQAKKMILSRYVRNQAKPDYMIMTNELLLMKFECKNPKVADVIAVAIKELIEAGFVYESGLGIHLSNKGYDYIF